MELPDLPLLRDLPAAADEPVRKIYTEQDMSQWRNCAALSHIELIISRFAQAVRDQPNLADCFVSETTQKIVTFVKEAQDLIQHVPLDPSPQRFGNKAFRDWVARIEERIPAFLASLIPENARAALPELDYHLENSFGSPVRLDYGTGHELAFVCFLLVLRLIGALEPRDEQACVTRVFVAYMDCCRALQKAFRLEPAGSKGVWGLDDHQHLVYLWGASQLRSAEEMKPSIILSPQSGQQRAHDYLFLSSILHVHELKKGPLSAHSPLLHSIGSTVPSWTKVETGLTRMYRDEVLLKLPVVQHIRFGVVLAWKDAAGRDLPCSADTATNATMTGQSGAELHREGSNSGGNSSSTGSSSDSVVGHVEDEMTVAPWAVPRLPQSHTSSSSSHSHHNLHQQQQRSQHGDAQQQQQQQQPTLFVSPAPFSRRRSSVPSHPSPLRQPVDLPESSTSQSIDEQAIDD